MPDETKTGYQRLLEKCAPPPTAQKSAEESLDALLSGRPADGPHPANPPAAPAAAPRLDPRLSGSPLDPLRKLFSEELVPMFEVIKAKYQTYGIGLVLDISDFLAGGRRVVIEFQMPPQSIRLEGTAVNEGIAFNEIHSYSAVPGAISSGPMLRTRLLNAEKFRDFLCARLAPLVRTKLRQK